MNIALIVGFYTRVGKALDVRFPAKIYKDRLIVIPPAGNAIAMFKSRMYELATTATGILVCLGRSENQQHLEEAARGVVRVLQAEKPALPITFLTFSNLYESDPILGAVETFGIETVPKLDAARIRTRVPNGKILCMSLAGKTSISVALGRAGFDAEAIAECFDEEIREGARNSNLMQDLQNRSASHAHLLYAWEGLRTMTPDVKKSFQSKCHEARSAAQVVELFRVWITEGV